MRVEINGQRLRRLMSERGLIGEELAKMAGFSRQTLSNYINGHRRPNYESLTAIAEALGVPHMELVKSAEEKVAERRRRILADALAALEEGAHHAFNC